MNPFQKILALLIVAVWVYNVLRYLSLRKEARVSLVDEKEFYPRCNWWLFDATMLPSFVLAAMCNWIESALVITVALICLVCGEAILLWMRASISISISSADINESTA